MSIISRLYNFVDGTNSSAEAVDAEFDQILAYLNASVVLKDGTVAMTGALTLPSNPTLALHAATKQYVDGLVTAPAFPGVVTMYGGLVPPVGWLECNGQAVSRATYAALFAAVGVTHGAGDGSTTFNVPDLRGRCPVGTGTGAGLVGVWPAGLKYGSEWLQAHTHSFTEIGVVQFPLGKVNGDATIGLPYGTNFNGTQNAGSGNMQNFQPSLGILFIIKT